MSEEGLPGRVEISEDVIKKIASTAALQIDGVLALAGSVKEGIREFFVGRDVAKGVSVVEQTEKEVSMRIHLVIEFGRRIPEVAQLVQYTVKKQVEEMTGLTVREVDVEIVSVREAEAVESSDTEGEV